MKPTLTERLPFMLKAIKYHLGLMGIISVFFLGGALLVYVSTLATETETKYFLFIFGALFGGIPTLFFLWTMPSSLMYHYEKQLVKKYGTQTQGTLLKKYTEQQGVEYPHTICFWDYSFSYQGVTYNATAVIDSKKRYESLGVGDAVKVKFLRYAPSNSSLVKTRAKK